MDGAAISSGVGGESFLAGTTIWILLIIAVVGAVSFTPMRDAISEHLRNLFAATGFGSTPAPDPSVAGQPVGAAETETSSSGTTGENPDQSSGRASDRDEYDFDLDMLVIDDPHDT